MPPGIEHDAAASSVEMQPFQRDHVGCVGVDSNPKSTTRDARPAAIDALGPDSERFCDGHNKTVVTALVKHTDHPAREHGGLGGGEICTGRGARARGAASRA